MCNQTSNILILTFFLVSSGLITITLFRRYIGDVKESYKKLEKEAKLMQLNIMRLEDRVSLLENPLAKKQNPKPKKRKR